MSRKIEMDYDVYKADLEASRLLGMQQGQLAEKDRLFPLISEISFITQIVITPDATTMAIPMDGVCDKYRWHLRDLMYKIGEYKK